jgi:acyl carrier protein
MVIEQLGVEASEVTPGASLVEDLNADSLDLVEYIMTVEQVFQVQISDEDAEKLTTVGETQAYLQEKGVL